MTARGIARTITREYSHEQDRQRDMAQLTARGWLVQNIAHIPGNYNAGLGCLLAIFFLPLALLAGRSPDRWLVTYGTPDLAAQAPTQIAHGAAARSRNYLIIGALWAFGVFALFFMCRAMGS